MRLRVRALGVSSESMGLDARGLFGRGRGAEVRRSREYTHVDLTALGAFRLLHVRNRLELYG